MTATEPPAADLTDVATSTLERLRSLLGGGQIRAPIVRAELLSYGIVHQLETLEAALGGHSRLACLSVLDVALAERARAARPAPELVWSGPEHTHATARDTAVVLRALFESATREVILAGFSFVNGRQVLEPLHRVMTERALSVRFFIEVKQIKRAEDVDDHLRKQVSDFFSNCWPKQGPRPLVYVDKRSLVPPPPYSSLHAKCVVVDRERAFVSSANFSDRAHERNIEAGVLLHDPVFADHLARQWLGLIDANLVALAASSHLFSG